MASTSSSASASSSSSSTHSRHRNENKALSLFRLVKEIPEKLIQTLFGWNQMGGFEYPLVININTADPRSESQFCRHDASSSTSSSSASRNSSTMGEPADSEDSEPCSSADTDTDTDTETDSWNRYSNDGAEETLQVEFGARPIDFKQNPSVVVEVVNADRSPGFIYTLNLGNGKTERLHVSALRLSAGSYGTVYRVLQVLHLYHPESGDSAHVAMKIQDVSTAENVNSSLLPYWYGGASPEVFADISRLVYTASPWYMECVIFFLVWNSYREAVTEKNADAARRASYLLDHMAELYSTFLVNQEVDVEEQVDGKKQTRKVTKTRLVFFEEYIPGNVYKRTRSTVDLDSTVSLCKGLSTFFKYLGDMGIYMYDTHPANIMIRNPSHKPQNMVYYIEDENDYVLIDFGVCRVIDNHVLAKYTQIFRRLTRDNQVPEEISLLTSLESMWPYNYGMGGCSGESLFAHYLHGDLAFAFTKIKDATGSQFILPVKNQIAFPAGYAKTMNVWATSSSSSLSSSSSSSESESESESDLAKGPGVSPNCLVLRNFTLVRKALPAPDCSSHSLQEHGITNRGFVGAILDDLLPWNVPLHVRSLFSLFHWPTDKIDNRTNILTRICSMYSGKTYLKGGQNTCRAFALQSNMQFTDTILKEQERAVFVPGSATTLMCVMLREAPDIRLSGPVYQQPVPRIRFAPGLPTFASVDQDVDLNHYIHSNNVDDRNLCAEELPFGKILLWDLAICKFDHWDVIPSLALEDGSLSSRLYLCHIFAFPVADLISPLSDPS